MLGVVIRVWVGNSVIDLIVHLITVEHSLLGFFS